LSRACTSAHQIRAASFAASVVGQRPAGITLGLTARVSRCGGRLSRAPEPRGRRDRHATAQGLAFRRGASDQWTHARCHGIVGWRALVGATRKARRASTSAADRLVIREAIRAAWVRPVRGGLSLQARFSDACGAAAEVTDGLWDVESLRPTEQEAWDALRSAAITRVERVAEAALLVPPDHSARLDAGLPSVERGLTIG
jgi:hypothetical protein